ncbi:M56 family peptidase [Mucilaginibacter limnophilus]|uniref:M56 family peptidase n=1 Tax=Mucilaginibacter limnophilus TaxID=1932778 RepID=A0A437MKG3_9SPHI|nr:M56 family metallopeptidase [Mucilaginibacter limnophilus]RVT98085.1 M56 family peptidase [Mucilaginibacter limnophilus]
MNWLYYLLEANIYLNVFYLAYYLLLSRDTHYNLNRAYLLCICCVAPILPLLQIGVLKPFQEQSVTTSYINQATSLADIRPPAVHSFNWQDTILYLYVAGVVVTIALLAIKLIRLYQLSAVNVHHTGNGYKIVYLESQNTAFSFFNNLFISTQVTDINTIIQHEQVHIRQKHSVDILFTEIIKIVFWFNPLVYLLQNSLKIQHEYIADEETAGNDNLAYSTFLVNNAYGLSGGAVTNSFFNYKLLKKRIIMLNKQRSGKLARLKYLLTVPLCAGMLCASTLSFSKNYGVDLLPRQVKAIKAAPASPDTVPQPPTVTSVRRSDKPLNELFNHIAKTVTYPAQAREKKVAGTVWVKFSLSSEGVIRDIKIDKSVGSGLDEAVIKSMKSFTGIIAKKSGPVTFPVTFKLMNKDNKPVGESKSELSENDQYSGVVVVGFVK